MNTNEPLFAVNDRVVIIHHVAPYDLEPAERTGRVTRISEGLFAPHMYVVQIDDYLQLAFYEHELRKEELSGGFETLHDWVKIKRKEESE